MTQRENVLKRISVALRRADTEPYPDLPGDTKLFYDSGRPLADRFIAEFAAIDGQVLRCKDAADMLQKLQQLMADRGWYDVDSQSAYLSSHVHLPGCPDWLRKDTGHPVIGAGDVGI